MSSTNIDIDPATVPPGLALMTEWQGAAVIGCGMDFVPYESNDISPYLAPPIMVDGEPRYRFADVVDGVRNVTRAEPVDATKYSILDTAFTLFTRDVMDGQGDYEQCPCRVNTEAVRGYLKILDMLGVVTGWGIYQIECPDCGTMWRFVTTETGRDVLNDVSGLFRDN